MGEIYSFNLLIRTDSVRVIEYINYFGPPRVLMPNLGPRTARGPFACEYVYDVRGQQAYAAEGERVGNHNFGHVLAETSTTPVLSDIAASLGSSLPSFQELMSVSSVRRHQFWETEENDGSPEPEAPTFNDRSFDIILPGPNVEYDHHRIEDLITPTNQDSSVIDLVTPQSVISISSSTDPPGISDMDAGHTNDPFVGGHGSIDT